MATSEGKKLRSVVHSSLMHSSVMNGGGRPVVNTVNNSLAGPSLSRFASSSDSAPSGLPARTLRKSARIPKLQLPASRAELFDYRYLTGRSSARIALFEIDALVATDEVSGQTDLASQFWRSESRLVDGNETFCSAYGSHDTSAFVGKSFQFFFPPTDQHRAMIEQWVRDGLVLGHFDLEMTALTGETKSFSVAMYAVDERSAVRRFWIVLRDVTPLANALREVSQQEQHYRDLVEGSGFFVLRVDQNGTPRYVSPSLETLVGFPAQEFRANPNLFRSLIHPDDIEAYESILQARLSTGTPITEVEYRILCKDGTYRWLFERQTCLERMRKEADAAAAPQRYFDSLLFDIQERKTLEAEVRHAQRMDMVGQLAGGVAHDFNNYLTAILGQIRLSLSELSPNSPTYQRLLATEEAAIRCSDMTKQLLSMSRRDGVSKRSIQLNKLISSTAALCSHLMPSSICLSSDLGEQSVVSEGDEGQLQQVLMNLLVNARDAIRGTGSIRITLGERIVGSEAARYGQAPGKYAEIRIIDSGDGIPSEQLQHIFEPFFTTKPAGQGTGLGLSLVYSIMRNHGGSVSVQSQIGVGSEFTLLLPLASESSISADSKQPSNAHSQQYNQQNSVSRNSSTFTSQPPLFKKQEEVLVVDDEPLVRSVIKAALLGSGYAVAEATNGVEALDLVLQSPGRFSLLVVDQTMPKLSGNALVSELRAAGIRTPLLLTTGLAAFDGIPKNDPAIEVIIKPFDPIELISAAYRLCSTEEDED